MIEISRFGNHWYLNVPFDSSLLPIASKHHFKCNSFAQARLLAFIITNGNVTGVL